jgi:hypothetical protein
MSASFYWELVKPHNPKSFRCGTSSDAPALKETFPSGVISTADLNMLHAMHRAATRGRDRDEETLWSDIARTLERLQGDDYEKVVSIKVWVGY